MHALLPPPSEADEQAQYEAPERELNAVLDDASRRSETVGVDRVRVSNLAHLLHQRFKEDFIARMPTDGGHIPIAQIRQWIEQKRSELRKLGPFCASLQDVPEDVPDALLEFPIGTIALDLGDLKYSRDAPCQALPDRSSSEYSSDGSLAQKRDEYRTNLTDRQEAAR
jgi:hypothetical protein